MTEPAINVEHLTKTYRIGRSISDVPVPSILPGGSRRSRLERKGDDDDVADDEDDLEEGRDDVVDEQEEERKREQRESSAAETGTPRLVHALRDLSLEVAPGSRLAILGRWPRASRRC